MSSSEVFFRKYSWFILIVISYLFISKFSFSLDLIWIYARQICLLSIVVFGVMVFTMTGEINLCIGAQISVTYVLLLYLNGILKIPLMLAMLMGILVAILLANIYSVLNAKYRIKAIYITFASEITLISFSNLIVVNLKRQQLHSSFDNVFYKSWLGIPSWLILWGILFSFFYIMINKWTIGRCFSYVNHLENHHEREVLPIKNIKRLAFLICTCAISIYTCLLYLRMGSAYGTFTTDITFDVMVALCVGGVGLSSHKGKIRNVLIGTTGVILLNNLIYMAPFAKNLKLAINGIIILSSLYLLRSIHFKPSKDI